MDAHITDKQIDWFICNQMNILKECAGAAQNEFNLEVILEEPDGFASDMEKFAYAKCRFRGAIDAASDLGIISRESLGCIYSAFNKWKEYKISGKDIDEWLDTMKNVLTAAFRDFVEGSGLDEE